MAEISDAYVMELRDSFGLRQPLPISLLLHFFWVLSAQVAVRAGGFSVLAVVGTCVIGISILYTVFYVWLGVDTPGGMKVTELPLLLVCYGFGASFVALFAQLGG